MANPIIKEIKDEFYNKVHPITEIKAVFDENGTSLEEILQTTVVTDVDDELSNESVNPVQNKVITEALNSKANSSDIQELSEEIATKADSSTVEALSNTVDTKANSSDVNNAIKRLYNSFSEALAALKNTAIAKAVGATGDTFTSVIAKLATIIDRGKVTKTLNTSTTSYTIPAGYHNGQGSVSISTQSKSVTPTTSSQSVVPDEGKVLSSVSVGTQVHNETYKATSRGTSLDMGVTHNNRYVNTNDIPNSNSGTYSATSRGASIDLGATNTYRYINTNGVPNSNSSTYAATARSASIDLGATNTYRYINTNRVPTTTENGGISILFTIETVNSIKKPCIGVCGMGGFTKADWENIPNYGINVLSEGTHTYSLTGGLSLTVTYNGTTVTTLKLTNNTGNTLSYFISTGGLVCTTTNGGGKTVYSWVASSTFANGAEIEFITRSGYCYYIPVETSDNIGAVNSFTIRLWKR